MAEYKLATAEEILDEKERVTLRKKNDNITYTLLTPTFPGRLFRPAFAKRIEDLEVDHEPSIAEELKRLKADNKLPLIDSISDNMKSGLPLDFSKIKEAELISEMKVLHKDIELRMMEKEENRAKGKK